MLRVDSDHALESMHFCFRGSLDVARSSLRVEA